MVNVVGKLAEKIGVVVQAGGTLYIENFNIEGSLIPSRPRKEQLLLKQVIHEVYSRLKQSNHDNFITLDKESQPSLVSRPWDVDMKAGPEKDRLIAPETALADLFRQPEMGGRLLILGEPGAGKSTTQLTLAQSLLKKEVSEDVDYPMPVLLNLATWQKDQTIADWLAQTLNDKYGVRATLGRQWIDEKKLLPLLDGLDELNASLQPLCVDALNEFLSGDQAPEHVVVGCRREEYDLLDTRLRLNGAIRLKSLTDQQIENYLVKIGQPQLWGVISNDPQLLALVKTPLMLSRVGLIAQETTSEDWHSLHSSGDRQQTVWDAYVQQFMNPDNISRIYPAKEIPSRRESRQWLNVLARNLQAQSQDEFLIEQMQPQDWLTRSQQRLYIGISSISGALGLIIMSGLFVLIRENEAFETAYLSFSIWDWFKIVTVTWGIIGALFMGLKSIIRPVESIRWSWTQARKKIISRFPYWFILWFCLWFINGVLVSLNIVNTPQYAAEYAFHEVPSWMIFLAFYWFCLLWGMILGLIYATMSVFAWEGFIGGLVGPDITVRSFPNQGIKRSAMNAAKFCLIGIISGIVIGRLAATVFQAHIHSPWRYALGAMLPWAFFVALIGGGKACLQHVILRFLLYRQGKLPWDYAKFLDYCTERLLLQRVGGRYRFMHRLLRDHFATMPLSDKP